MNRKEGHNDFNVYYMNFSKVYEIAMMINNQIVKSYQREKGQQVEDTYSLAFAYLVYDYIKLRIIIRLL